ncbi:putative ATPase/DNA-binding XRE family transcriptional regulator [Kitasatospora sp. MAA4]|uniref:helix-turn-helix domain-containing protein n=1 Tax=Kitasatospora sp. MAA4 TaxID=3035093 RepID=UPI0024765D32|nr:helix-turn-helix domain-containing protein [Kitasatospora sp. MAA4]MDH6136258.1 putative ATPase/DNA-binding XRE family transcriptional regulator [Kitasatospora sp. MAA4]
MDGGQPVSSFGELLKIRRERAGLTQQSLADYATLSVRAVRDMETGRVRRPRHETVRLLADALRIEGRTRSSFEAAARQREFASEPVAPPAARNAMVAREAETEALFEALTVHGDRLVSVVGLDGVGKSRLALEVAWRVHDAVQWSVQWTPCGEREVVGGGSALAHGRFDGLAELIDTRPTLLVLDGADGGVNPAMLDELFHRCAGLRVLITSRAPQGLDGEQVIPLAPLETPVAGQDGDVSALGAVGSVRLLVSHMRRLRPGFTLGQHEAPVIAELCRYLDGLPRALEFAAGWTAVQSPGQLMERLTGSPFALAAPPVTSCERGDVRESLNRTLRALAPRQRALLARLADEEQGWSVEEAVLMTGRPVQECLEAVHELFSRGVIRAAEGAAAHDGVRFTVLNLFRVLCREERNRWSTAAAGRHEFPVLTALAG